MSAEDALFAPSLYPRRLDARHDNLVNSLFFSVGWNVQRRFQP
ncbi:hypothetical protein [Pseudomonas fluorescens]|nr:hypothetical protein [Pseudomonas fluorescens]